VYRFQTAAHNKHVYNKPTNCLIRKSQGTASCSIPKTNNTYR